MPGTAIDPSDPGSLLRGLRRSRGLSLGDVADVLGVGPEALALLEAGEWGAAFADPDGEALLFDYARALGLDQAVIQDWLTGLRDPAGESGAGGAVGPGGTGGDGCAGDAGGAGGAERVEKPPLSGPARFAARAPRPGAPSPSGASPSPSGTAPSQSGPGLSKSPPSPWVLGPKSPERALTEARVRAGLTQDEAARLLGMRPDFVAAMDRGDIDRLPHGHERGMLTRYALLVGLYPDLVLERLVGLERHVWAQPRRRRHRKRLALWIRFSGGALIVTGLVLAAISLS